MLSSFTQVSEICIESLHSVFLRDEFRQRCEAEKCQVAILLFGITKERVGPVEPVKNAQHSKVIVESKRQKWKDDENTLFIKP